LEILEDRTLLSVCTVDRLTDLGEGSGLTGDLRYCITNAADGDEITFGVTGTINLTRALPSLTHSISIEGPGADIMTVRGATGGSGSVFFVASSRMVSISDLTISNGHADIGGGISNSGTLTVNNSTVSGNTATFDGGGISNSGTLTVNNSTVSGNTGGFDGGGIENDGTLTVNNSTISQNTTIQRSSFGGGIYNNVLIGGMMTARNTIIAGNTATGGPDVYGNLGSQGHNLIGNSSDGSGFGPTDLLDVDPLLGPLQDNGGPTWTYALMPGSPAVDAGDPTEIGIPDQRGVIRSGGVNIGAYQASASAFLLTAPETVNAGVPFDLIVTVVDRFGQAAVGYTGTVTFSTTDLDKGVVLPADYTFTPEEGGVHKFTDTGLGETTLITPGDQTVTATDTKGDSITGNAIVTVTSGDSPHMGRDNLQPVFRNVFGSLISAKKTTDSQDFFFIKNEFGFANLPSS
jgi:hypothetical protein